MSAIPAGGSARELPSEDTHNAVCIQVIDLGTQHSEQWGDKRKVQLGFELVEEETSEGRAMVVYKQYTFSDSEKSNLMKDLKAWGMKPGKGFDMDTVLNKGAMVTVEHSTTDRGTFANIVNLSSVPKGVKVRKATEAIRSLYLDETFEQDVFDALPEFLRNKIATSPEFAAVTAPKLKKPAKVATPAKKVAPPVKRR